MTSEHNDDTPALTNNASVLPPLSIDVVRTALSEFFAHNVQADLEKIGDKEEAIAVTLPWGDPSLSILILGNDDSVISALNSVYLPERFTALWHRDTSLLEVIFTADPMPAVWQDLPNRSFAFKHRGKEHQCEFRASSHRLLRLAARAFPRTPTRSNFRNLMSFQRHLFSIAGHEKFPKQENATPLSFWVSGIEWNDDAVVDLALHLNFYMTYYDNVSPLIIIHTPESESAASRPAIRFPFGEFPKTIASRPLDENLIHFWQASREGDPVRRFIYSYQILEYAASYYLEENVKRAIRRSVSAPNALDKIDKVTQEVIDALAENRIGEPQKLEALLKALVNPTVIWNEIESHLAFFVAPITFEGGFVVGPIAKVGWTADDFGISWCPKFPSTIRSIRNALAHGRDQRMGTVITPTTANLAKLQSWVPLIAAAAREVMVYNDVV